MKTLILILGIIYLVSRILKKRKKTRADWLELIQNDMRRLNIRPVNNVFLQEKVIFIYKELMKLKKENLELYGYQQSALDEMWLEVDNKNTFQEKTKSIEQMRSLVVGKRVFSTNKKFKKAEMFRDMYLDAKKEALSF